MIEKFSTTRRIADAVKTGKKDHLSGCEINEGEAIALYCRSASKRGKFVIKYFTGNYCTLEYHYGYALSDECSAQVEMVSQLCGGDERCVDDLLLEFGQEMRQIVEGFELKFDRIPTPDEIKWVMSERRKQDITEIVNNMGVVKK